jgi:acyl-CoA reductase-like NAD-dependent aldehyde dehydrogenase
MSVINQLLYVDALGPNGAYRSQNRLAVADVAGHPLAELSLVPRLFVTRAMAALHKAQTLPLEERLTALARAGKLLRQADLSMVYGGQEVIERYAANPTVLPNGPGRSKILVTADSDWHSFLDMIVASISHEGGTACVNTTAVFVEGDPTPVAEAIAERLAAIPSLPPEDEQAMLTAYSLEAARQIERYLLAKAAGTRAHLGGDRVVENWGMAARYCGPPCTNWLIPLRNRRTSNWPSPVCGWRRGRGRPGSGH